jgi:hypothetical protein
VFAKGLVIHKEVDHIAVAVDGVDPAGKLVGPERPLVPGPIGKPKCYVITEAVVLKQKLKRLRIGRTVDEVRTSVAQDIICSFYQYRVEAAQPVNQRGQIIVVDKLGVSENAGRLAKKLLDSLLVRFNLFDELIYRV